MSTSSSSSSGIGLFGLLGVLFIGLKLTHIINWSWWAVLAPLYLGPLFILAVLGLILVIVFLVALLK